MAKQTFEKAIKKFEEGVQLSKFCAEKLDETEKRVTLLLQDQKGDFFEKTFSSENDLDDDETEI